MHAGQKGPREETKQDLEAIAKADVEEVEMLRGTRVHIECHCHDFVPIPVPCHVTHNS